MVGKKQESVPTQLKPVFDTVVGLTDAVCKDHLNDEYGELCRKLAAALCRKRPSPMAQGKPEVWACGIAYTIGFVNFLFDKTQSPYLSADQLCGLFGVGKSAGYAKSRAIRDAFRVQQFDPRWCLPSLIPNNPYVWMIEVDGFIVDVRHESREFQEEALRRGLIPYLPEPRRVS